MTRRDFLKASLAAGAGLSSCMSHEAVADTTEKNGKLIFSAPLTHSDWMLKPGVAWGPEGVRHMLDTCKACGWSRVYWRALDGGRALYKSKLLRAQGKWDDDNFWNPQSEADKELTRQFTNNKTPQDRATLLAKVESLDYSHFDSLGEAVKYGQKIGLQIHAWVSINEDDHGWGLQSEFTKKHPEFRWRRRDGRVYHSQLSFAFEEVRKYKLGILEELLINYPLDGLFLDWIRTGDVRDNPQTDSDGIADSGYETPLLEKFQKQFGIDAHSVTNSDERWVRLRAEPQTEFLRAARKLARSQKNPRPISVMVGHPWHYRGLKNKIDGNLRGLLLDVRTWAREGLIDSAVAAGYYRDGGTADKAWHALRQETESKVDVWMYAWVPQTAADFDRDFTVASNLGAKQILFWEADYIDDRANASELKAAMARRAL